QQLDWDGLWGRLMSCSYAPQASHPQHLPLLNHLQQAFTEYQQQGRVDFIYQTQVYCGQLRAV
ncbi:MAG: SAM-dependent methyltransferase, partial [Cyanobacteria bacterium P01_A01_bin.105]